MAKGRGFDLSSSEFTCAGMITARTRVLVHDDL